MKERPAAAAGSAVASAAGGSSAARALLPAPTALVTANELATMLGLSGPMGTRVMLAGLAGPVSSAGNILLVNADRAAELASRPLLTEHPPAFTVRCGPARPDTVRPEREVLGYGAWLDADVRVMGFDRYWRIAHPDVLVRQQIPFLVTVCGFVAEPGFLVRGYETSADGKRRLLLERPAPGTEAARDVDAFTNMRVPSPAGASTLRLADTRQRPGG